MALLILIVYAAITATLFDSYFRVRGPQGELPGILFGLCYSFLWPVWLLTIISLILFCYWTQ